MLSKNGGRSAATPRVETCIDCRSRAYAYLFVVATALIPGMALSQSVGPLSPSAGASNAAISGSVWSFPTNVNASDDQYSVTGLMAMSTTQALAMTSFGFALPPLAVIRGIEGTVEKRSVGGLVTDNAVRILKNGALGTTDRSALPAWPTSDGITTYGGAADLWGTTWTAADINATGFGIAISAIATGFDAAAVDHATLTVFYSLCGDGIVSPGEQCDDGNTDPGDCCSPTCQFESANTICRPAIGECDPAETCTGSSAVCPADVRQPVGSTCADDGDVCTSDTCDANVACVRAPVANANCQYKPGKLIIVKQGTLAKFISKDVFGLPTGGNSPTQSGATVQFLDTIFGGAGAVTFDLPAGQWRGLGNPPGASGFKYKGAGTLTDPCKIVLIKEKVVKAVCKGPAVTLVPPFDGEAGVVLEVGTTPVRYCAEFLGTTVQNSSKLLKRKDAPAPSMCSRVLPTPTPTVPTRTPTFTKTLTPSTSPTPTVTPTRTGTGTPGPSFTPSATGLATSTRTNSATPTRTPTVSTVCGNHVIEPGETCSNCSTDCQVLSCTAVAPLRNVSVNYVAPPDTDPTGITVLVGYRSDHISIPMSGNNGTVAGRVKNKPSNAIVQSFDLDYALRVVLSRSSPFPSGRLFTIDFDSCSGAPAPTAADLACTVQGCANTFGSVAGCTCSVTVN